MAKRDPRYRKRNLKIGLGAPWVFRDSFGTLENSGEGVRARFGDWLFDSEARELTRGRRAIELTPKAFELLRVLLENRPRALPKAELHDLLWPKTFVSPTSLARLVTEIRKALEDPARAPRFVRTAYGHGYSFCGEATELPDPAAAPTPPSSGCSLLRGAREIGLPEGESVLGRTPDAVVRIHSSRVSRRHARILVAGTRATLEDLASKNGTYLRGRRIDGPVVLSDGDEICVGPEVLIFCSSGGQGSTKTGTR